ncbi:hypothetical protein [Roseococcus pinisoli]|uniref:Uncharacterized protein n=1 Tax=Roseococcus pinisoli TaxID=2835040 RepID=A0ABS5QFD0_9PROT|nr:hypothetical protein [Roseococcus pinisoli]MBS7812274.1 hypothetical protein [Roseococcus pinisoli]
MLVFITKHALTTGIWSFDGEVKQSGNMIRFKGEKDTLHHHYHGEGREWHLTLEAAQKRAEEMRLAKLASLRKSVEKFEGTTFGLVKAL